MQLSLFQATLFSGIVLLALGGSLLFAREATVSLLRGFPRSSRAAVALMALALAWTGLKVWHLSSVDYGDFRQYLLIGFGLLGLLSFKFAADFLSVRAACILYLFVANLLVDAAWMQYEAPLRLLLVTPVYLGIALSLYLAYAPFRLRDAFTWTFSRPARIRATGIAFAAYGLLLCGVSFSF